MKYTEKEILDALRVIKGVCKEYGMCCECPLRASADNDDCYLYQEQPDKWILVGEDEGAWRAFK